MTEKTCKNCWFWVAGKDQPRNGEDLGVGGGECRRRAPIGGGITAYFATGKKANKMISVLYPWPATHEADWCGEHKETIDETLPF